MQSDQFCGFNCVEVFRSRFGVSQTSSTFNMTLIYASQYSIEPNAHQFECLSTSLSASFDGKWWKTSPSERLGAVWNAPELVEDDYQLKRGVKFRRSWTRVQRLPWSETLHDQNSWEINSETSACGSKHPRFFARKSQLKWIKTRRARFFRAIFQMPFSAPSFHDRWVFG
jgi:hypothetical protein